MAPDFLSEVELYYTNKPVVGNKISIEGDECHHIANVMRHKVGDSIYVTDGIGKIYKSLITSIGKKIVFAEVIKSTQYENKSEKIWFCIPRLKSADRFEFALEKSVELGITNFIIFDSTRTVAKGEKIDRWEKILIAAMKQSLRAWLPNVAYSKNLSEIFKPEGTKILFDQNAKQTFQQFLLTNHQSLTTNHYFIFGPEGGFTEDEFRIANSELRIRLTENRLRSETAIVTAASLIATVL